MRRKLCIPQTAVDKAPIYTELFGNLFGGEPLLV